MAPTDVHGSPHLRDVKSASNNHKRRIFVLSHLSKAGALRSAKGISDYVQSKSGIADNDLLSNLAHTLNLHRTAFD